jgi:hypothetical protein
VLTSCSTRFGYVAGVSSLALTLLPCVVRGQVGEDDSTAASEVESVDRSLQQIDPVHVEPEPIESITAERRFLYFEPSRELLHPGPGRVPLHVYTTRTPLTVGMIPGQILNRRGLATASPLLLCQTPCTLYVVPGEVPLYTETEGHRAYRTILTVPPDGLGVQMRSSTIGRQKTGVLFSVLGPVTVAIGAGMFASGASGSLPLFLLGIDTIAKGLAALIGGGVLLTGNRRGVAHTAPLSTVDRGRESL